MTISRRTFLHAMKTSLHAPIFCSLSLMLALAVGESVSQAQHVDLQGVPQAKAEKSGGLYTSNRAPLQSAALVRLPIGSVTPKGWLRRQLELEAAGQLGQLSQISKFLAWEGNGWVDPKGSSGWEELPYWLKGYADLGYVLGDEKMIAETRRWIEGILAAQQPDGWFGPLGLKTAFKQQGLNSAKPDMWPHMPVLNALQSYYEYSGDRRVLEFMTRYFRWQNQLPVDCFGAGYWPRMRFGDNLETVHWLYNRTGEPWLLDLGRKIHENMADWTTGLPNWHNVNIAQCFREPAEYWLQAGDAKFLGAAERNYQEVTGLYGQFPGGGFAGDENCRPGYTDPHQGFETCGIVEFMRSFQMLQRISGNPLWADRCEEIAFNTLPAAMTPDLKALKYLTCANQAQLDRKNKAPGIQNSGNMFSYSPHIYRCCQHNHGMGWPYYAEELWLATADGGLCASLYAASEVRAKVGDGVEVKIEEQTDYPFGETIQLKISMPRPVAFPLWLRVPRWCREAAIAVNGKPVEGKMEPLSYAVVRRTWADGDTVALRLPMQVSLRTWAKNKNAASVDRGPLTYSLKIKERWVASGGTEKWPEWEVFPDSPWNYGLVLDDRDPARSFEVIREKGPLAGQPFKPETVPVALRAKAKKIPNWQLDRFGLAAVLRPSPVQSDEPEETVTLIPMGAARLRIASFPVIGSGPDARPWPEPRQSAVKASASHCFEGDTLDALDDGLEPKSSDDRNIPRFTWWPRRGGEAAPQWVQYDFAKPRKVGAVAVYWFDDTGRGHCRVPKSWRLLARQGDQWKPVESKEEFGVKKDAYNRVAIAPVVASALRIEVQFQPEFSGGILEWRVEDSD